MPDARAPAVTKVADERRHGAIGLEREPLEMPDSRPHRVQTQLGDQQPSNPAPLPVVDHLDRRLGHLRMLGPHIVSSSNGSRRRDSERDHASMINTIDTGDDEEVAI